MQAIKAGEAGNGYTASFVAAATFQDTPVTESTGHDAVRPIHDGQLVTRF